MKTGIRGLDLIKEKEGFKPKMYLCSAGIPTIGYGTAIDTKEEEYLKSATLSKDQAETLLRKDVAIFESYINKMVQVPLNQNQYDALVCLVYNIGPTQFKSSTALTLINIGITKGDKLEKAWLAWNKATVRGVLTIISGLVLRRKTEYSLFTTPVY